MWSISVSIIPIFLLLILGYVLRRKAFPSDEFWAGADKVTYWILFPALLFYRTTTAPLDGEIVGSYALALMGALCACSIFAIIASKLLKLSNRLSGAVFQGATRHNTFIAFATADMLFGNEGLLLAAVATSILVPPTNLFCVSALVTYQGNDAGNLKRRLLQELLRNPLLLAIVAGVTLNLTGIGKIPVLHDVANIISGSALPFALLCVGAGLRIRSMHTEFASLLVASISKLVVFPAIMIGIILLTGLDGIAAVVLVIYGAVPTASSGYALAKQLGSDAEATAAIITIQTLLSMISLPVTIGIASYYFL